ncbi:MAG TPA: HAMP domain-containing sensor histidine kinase [Pyrinomonadaceae bacterium]|jgi:signal transduction histidine kinase|nr:HAMP domain-containing sensor histidine kinase [Pyrinomonadaceae bacterium]
MNDLHGDILEARGDPGVPRPLLRRKPEAGSTEDALRTVNEFLAIVSHELRTPITAILGWAQLLGRGAADPERVAQALEVIERNALLQARLVEELVDYTRVVSADRLPLTARAFDLAPAVEEAVESVAPAAFAKRVHVVKRLGPAPCELFGDPVRLQQALTNLLSNAIKFTPAGGVVTISLEAGGRHHTIAVSDTGEGIEPAFLPFVFDHYRQAATGGGSGGLGLGLSIARHIVELHDGTITAHSRGPGEGAVFTVRLPREPAPRPQEGGSK